MSSIWISKFIVVGLSLQIVKASELISEPEILVAEVEKSARLILNPKIFIRSMYIISSNYPKQVQLKDKFEHTEHEQDLSNLHESDQNLKSLIKKDPKNDSSSSSSSESSEEIEHSQPLLPLPKISKITLNSEDEHLSSQTESNINKRENEYEHERHIDSFENSGENTESFRLLPSFEPHNEEKVIGNENEVFNEDRRPINEGVQGKVFGKLGREDSFQGADLGHSHFANRKGNHRRDFENDEELPRGLTVPFAYENNYDLWKQYRNYVIQKEKLNEESRL